MLRLRFVADQVCYRLLREKKISHIYKTVFSLSKVRVDVKKIIVIGSPSTPKFPSKKNSKLRNSLVVFSKSPTYKAGISHNYFTHEVINQQENLS